MDCYEIKRKIENLASKADQKTLAIWATDCANHVLHYFEEKYPYDQRPRKAIEAGRDWVNGNISVGEARKAAFAAHAAAREATSGVARSVARACGHASATAHVSGHAVHASNYAAAFVAHERVWQYEKLKTLMKI